MFTRAFWLDAAERAAKTAAQVLVGLLVGSATGLLGLDLLSTASTVGTAVLVSVLTSVISVGVGDKGTASLVPLAGRHEK